jgi:hypothetical protein
MGHSSQIVDKLTAIEDGFKNPAEGCLYKGDVKIVGAGVMPSQVQDRLMLGEGGDACMLQENMLEGLGILDFTQILEESFPPEIARLLGEGGI